MSNPIKTVCIVCIPIIALAVLISLSLLLEWSANTATCSRYSHVTGRETKAYFPSACYIKMPSGWYSDDQIKVTQ